MSPLTTCEHIYLPGQHQQNEGFSLESVETNFEGQKANDSTHLRGCASPVVMMSESKLPKHVSVGVESVSILSACLVLHETRTK